MNVSMLKDLEDKNISVKAIAMNNDTTTKARARREVTACLNKESEAYYAKKHLPTNYMVYR